MTEKLTTIASRVGRLMRDSIGEAAPEGPFGRLKKSFRFAPLPSKPVRVVVYSVYYWAIFVNDGRKGITGKQMLFYRDPEDDPRITEDYPRAGRLRKRLTSAQYREGLSSGKLVWTHHVGPVAPTRFIQKGIAKARPKASKTMLQFLQQSVRKVMRRTRTPGNLLKTKVTVVFGR